MKEVSESSFLSSLAGLRVVIVGPAPEPEYKTGFGGIIDSYDVVVRVNRGWRMSRESPDIFGSRTDILYHCWDPDPENGGVIDFPFLESSGCSLTVSPYPTLRSSSARDNMFHYDYRIRCKNWLTSHNTSVNFSEVGLDFYRKLDHNLQTRANSGTAAFLHLLQSNLAQLHIVGFSFFQKGYVSSYRKSIEGVIATDAEHSEALVMRRLSSHGQNHEMDKQINYCKPLLLGDKRIKPSTLLSGILNEQ